MVDSRLAVAEDARVQELTWDEQLDAEWYDYYYLRPPASTGSEYDKDAKFGIGRYKLSYWIPFKSPKMKQRMRTPKNSQRV